MKIAYFDCFSGASGDMILGALLDAGLPPDTLRSEIQKLGLSGYEIADRKVVKRGIAATQALIDISEKHHHPHRNFADIEGIINSSGLDAAVKGKAIAVFSRMAEAEAKVHGVSIDEIHFHEVGAMDAIIDVVGCVAGLAALGIEESHCSALNVGSGTVTCAHGVLPVPAPATAELIKGRPIYSEGVGELLTPTGAALLTTLARSFGPVPKMTLEQTGYGAGTSDRERPNVLRILIGEKTDGANVDSVAVIETNIDDMNPQMFEFVMETALASGALEVFFTPVQMKKNRPGILVTILCKPEQVETFSLMLLNHTTSIGVRHRIEQRFIAIREFDTIETEFGSILIKIAKIAGNIVNVAPEYEDCKRIARQKNLSIKHVYEIAKAAALQKYDTVMSE
jgi:pyridinium-3,5-bisthiocarboxylic acid mononucleotide nickel chelatase